MTWVYFTIFAALMQAIRYAGHKYLGQQVHVFLASWVRFSFGLPWALIAIILLSNQIYWHVLLDGRYFVFVFLIAIAQLMATIFSVMLLGRRNFAVGTTLIKSEAIFVAIFGLILFGESLSWIALCALLLGTCGILVISMDKFGLSFLQLVRNMDSVSAWLGLAAGALFAVSTIFIRHANQPLLDFHSPILQAVITLTLVLCFQTVLGLIFLCLYRPHILSQIKPNFKACAFTGITGVLGSFGWFSAFTLINAAYVKTLGQIEVVFTLLLTWFLFKEKIRYTEYFAIILILVASVIIIWF